MSAFGISRLCPVDLRTGHKRTQLTRIRLSSVDVCICIDALENQSPLSANASGEKLILIQVGDARRGRRTAVACLHVSLHLRRLRHPISGFPDPAQYVPDLHRGAAVRAGLGPVLDHAGGVTEHPQQQVPPPRDGAYDYRDNSNVRHRAARNSRADAGRQCAVGLHRPDRRRYSRCAEGPRRRRGNRNLPPALLHHDGGVEPCARGRTNLPACS